ncbi:acetylglutamate kinase [Idiomarina xiamenensis]|uniref:Acetylglutamate kinase n=1 Tax=Idiomarina xiamenensis 10-D-4 TaxID=740709 RepID=K2JZK4_9GAMM|nr:acetylglutamate kinase [Idiomarina xiamenensis]EKE80888.1 acetylglutamate kinase [Idiomarina xiamenensis 10-D-4]
MTSSVLVLKVGGRLLQQSEALSALLQVCQRIQQQRPLLLVHGGGEQIEHWLQQFQFSSTKVDGQRVTPAAHIPVIAGALAGDLNSQLVAVAQQAGLNAVGLTLAAGASIRCQIDHSRGCVGIPEAADKHLLETLLAQGFTPIMASLAQAADGQRLNVNADLAAAAVARLVDGDLVLLTDVDGILDKQGRLIDTINSQQAQQLIADGTVVGGMRVKLDAALSAAQHSRRSIAVAGWQHASNLLRLANGEQSGTRIQF